MEIEKINIEEVYGEPIDEDDTIFKLSNSGKKANMNVGELLLNLSRLYDESFRIPFCFMINRDTAIRIANDRHEGKLDKEWYKNEMGGCFYDN